MKKTNPNKRRGAVLMEFTLAGVAAITSVIATVQLSIGLWHYHTLAYAVHEATRYVASHGRGCTTGTTSCSITIGNIASKFGSDMVGVPLDSLSVTLVTDSGAATTCNPLTVCSTNTTRWPPTSNLDNTAGKRVTITANCASVNSALGIWPGAGSQRFSPLSFSASSTTVILF